MATIQSSTVFISDSGKQFHTIHIECLVPMEVDLNDFQLLRESLNVTAIQYANDNRIVFAEKG
jgi:hypothetical protein